MLGTILRNSMLDQFSREADLVLDGAVRPAGLPGTAGGAWPGFNLWREGDRLIAESEIPGYGPDDVEILATADTISVRGRRESGVPESATPLRVERSVSRFERSLRLPLEIDSDSVEAELRHGVLRIVMELAETAKARRVRVRALGAAPQRNALPSSGEAGT